MKKLVIGLVILVAFFVGVFCLLKSRKPEPQQVSQPPAPTHTADEGVVVFEMKYLGLSGVKDEIRYNAYWGFGQREKETPFIKEVKEKGGEFSTVYNSHFKGAEWSAVEVKDNKAVAFYFDLNADEPSGQNISRHDLISIIHHEGQFYNLKLSGHHDKDNKIQAELEPYDGTTGGLAINLNGKSNLKTKLNYARIVGSNDNTIRFVIHPDQTKLPTGAYRLERGYINYGDEKEDQWRVIFTNGSEFKVDADETKLVELGKPTLTISAVDEKKRYSQDLQEQTVYTKGTNVYISRVVKGKDGELYGRFSEKQDNSNRYTDLQPELKILDPDGKQIVEEKLRYG